MVSLTNFFKSWFPACQFSACSTPGFAGSLKRNSERFPAACGDVSERIKKW
jgi:hypothetical protein